MIFQLKIEEFGASIFRKVEDPC